MPAGDTYELSYEAIYEGQSVVNVFHAIQIGADGSLDPRKGLELAFSTDLKPLILSNLVNEYQELQIRTRGILLNETQTLLTLIGATGGIVGDGLPPNSVLMTRNYGLRAGLKGTGRTLWTGIAEGDTLQGIISIAALALWVPYEAAAAIPITDPVTGWVFQLAVKGSVDNVLRAFQRCETQPRMRTLRSRTIGPVGA